MRSKTLYFRVDIYIYIYVIPLFAGFYTSQVVWGWCIGLNHHQQTFVLWNSKESNFWRTFKTASVIEIPRQVAEPTNSKFDTGEASSPVPEKYCIWIRVEVDDVRFYQRKPTKLQLSHENNCGGLGYMGDYTTQSYRDCNKPLYTRIPINHPV